MSDIPTTSTAPRDQDLDSQDVEPSPIERRINEGRSYNDGNWTSVELKALFDGIAKYGTRPRAINYISNNLLKSRDENEIKVKLFEIREMVNENKEDCREYYKMSWLEKGHREILKNIAEYGNQDMDWIKVIDEINRTHHEVLLKYRNPIRMATNKVFYEQEMNSEVVEARVTDAVTARATQSEKQEIRWPLIHVFIQKCVSLESNLPALNELEAAVVASVLDNIEDEAAGISDKDKAVLCGLFADVAQIGDMRAFDADFPATTASALQVMVDPLRTRVFGVPEVGADPIFSDSNPTQKPFELKTAQIKKEGS